MQQVLIDSPSFFNTGYGQHISDIYSNYQPDENKEESMQAAILRKILVGPWIYGYFDKCKGQWGIVSRKKGKEYLGEEQSIWLRSNSWYRLERDEKGKLDWGKRDGGTGWQAKMFDLFSNANE